MTPPAAVPEVRHGADDRRVQGDRVLGIALHDPSGVESAVPIALGLGLLEVTTVFAATKATVQVRARVTATRGILGGAAGVEVDGYEIHAGRTEVVGDACPFIVARGRQTASEPEEAMSADGAVVGTYLHGLFSSPGLRLALLDALAHRRGIAPDPRWGTQEPPGARYDRLADAVTAALVIDALAKLVHR